jgi:GNAT superfamily N-acetyltransferase
MSGPAPPEVTVRNTQPEDFPGIVQLTAEVYPENPPWKEWQLASHFKVFPEGQFVAVEAGTNRVVGMAASLIVLWDDYGMDMNWRDFTDHGMFTNHDPQGRTLYGAEVMVWPGLQGRGIGKKIYGARRKLAERLGLLRIRAGARPRGYHRHQDRLGPEEYVLAVIGGKIGDPTLSIQHTQGFHVQAVAEDYLHHDPESLGHAAVIEWINEKVARPEDYAHRDTNFRKP